MLFYLLDKRIIDNTIRVDKMVYLPSMNYTLLTVDADVLMKCLTVADYGLSHVFTAGLMSLGKHCTVESSEATRLQLLDLYMRSTGEAQYNCPFIGRPD